MAHWSTALMVAAGTVAAVSPSRPAAAAALPPPVGVVTDLTWGISRAEMDRTIKLLVDTKVTSVRLNVSWSGVEPTTKGVYNTGWLAELDAAVTKARAAGLQVLMPMSDGVPYWASADPAKANGKWNKMWRPTRMSDYGDFVEFVVRRYSPSGVTSYELWNEPNLPYYWPSGVSAASYTEMLRAGSAAVRRVNPSAKVVLGGLAGNDSAYMAALYTAGAGPLFDIAAIHPYTGSVSPTQCWTDASGRKAKDAFCGIEAVRDVMVARGDSAKSLWLTEMGWSTANAQYAVTETQQANYITAAYAWLASRPYVTNTFMYSFRNTYWQYDAPSLLNAQYGLLRTDFSAKPGLAALRTVASQASGGTTSSTTVSSTSSVVATTLVTPTTTNKRKRR